MNSLNSTMTSVSAKALLTAVVLWLSGCATSTTEAAKDAEMVASQPAATDNNQTSGDSYTESSVVVSSSTELCRCDSNTSGSSQTQSATTQNRDSEWFGLTQPFQEAEPAMGIAQNSQLDSAAVNNGQPIPGLAVKQFSRRTLPSELAAAGADPQAYNSAPMFHQSRKSLSDYVAQLAFKLAGNQQLQGVKVGVASFVLFDSQLEQTSAIGNQLAEELSTVLPGYGAAVIEYKLTKNITVGPTGDLSLSRSTSKLRNPQGIDYVLTGTMTPTRRGLQITSRVVSTRDNVVISSASTLIPALVLQQL
ncbi:FlgO family outer membrane protein [Rheinheimera faecalis]|uniref:FlgO family outer membrane protein n=1 Tax=Rheinheimera faecalis TaxID=2901141 RepID=UPI001E5662D4|nr:FlgO family outer membrane protein [Rheinheimera faecalis]